MDEVIVIQTDTRQQWSTLSAELINQSLISTCQPVCCTLRKYGKVCRRWTINKSTVNAYFSHLRRSLVTSDKKSMPQLWNSLHAFVCTALFTTKNKSPEGFGTNFTLNRDCVELIYFQYIMCHRQEFNSTHPESSVYNYELIPGFKLSVTHFFQGDSREINQKLNAAVKMSHGLCDIHWMLFF